MKLNRRQKHCVKTFVLVEAYFIAFAIECIVLMCK